MAHLQVMHGYSHRIISMLRGLGYSSLILEGDGMPNKWGNIYIVTKNGRYFTNSTISTAVNWGKMCLNEDEFINETIKELKLLKEEK